MSYSKEFKLFILNINIATGPLEKIPNRKGYFRTVDPSVILRVKRGQHRWYGVTKYAHDSTVDVLMTLNGTRPAVPLSLLRLWEDWTRRYVKSTHVPKLGFETRSHHYLSTVPHLDFTEGGVLEKELSLHHPITVVPTLTVKYLAYLYVLELLFTYVRINDDLIVGDNHVTVVRHSTGLEWVYQPTDERDDALSLAVDILNGHVLDVSAPQLELWLGFFKETRIPKDAIKHILLKTAQVSSRLDLEGAIEPAELDTVLDRMYSLTNSEDALFLMSLDVLREQGDSKEHMMVDLSDTDDNEFKRTMRDGHIYYDLDIYHNDTIEGLGEVEIYLSITYDTDSCKVEVVDQTFTHDLNDPHADVRVVGVEVAKPNIPLK